MSIVNKNEILERINTFYTTTVLNGNKKVLLQPNDHLIALKKAKLEDEKDWLIQLQRCTPDYSIVNWTDLSDSYCYEYKILAHKNQAILDDDVELVEVLGGSRVDLRIFISLLGNYYYYFFEKSSYCTEKEEWKFDILTDLDSNHVHLVSKMKSLIEQKGYTYIPKETNNIVLEDVETEYMECNNVTIFHCLFSEFVTIR